LRQLQKRVTVNLVYDPKKSFLKPLAKKEADELDQIKQEEVHSEDEAEDSLMEDMTPQTKEPEPMKKAKSHHPAMLNLAASPGKS
jgi:hypothetical protein